MSSSKIPIESIVISGAITLASLAAAWVWLVKPKLKEIEQLSLVEPHPEKEGFSEGLIVSPIPLRRSEDVDYWPKPETLTPSQLFDYLLDRNKLFVDEHFHLPDLSAKRRREVADKGQFPQVAIITCADSRVPPEYLFGAGVGDLFLVRVAGNAIDRVALGSLEFAVNVLKVRLIILMGHSQCGALSAAVKHAKSEHPYEHDEDHHDHAHKPSEFEPKEIQREEQSSLWSVVECCLPAAREAVRSADPHSSESTIQEDAIARNVKFQADVLWTNSKSIREAVKSRRIVIRCARQFIRTGQVFEIAHNPKINPETLLAPPSPVFAPVPNTKTL